MFFAVHYYKLNMQAVKVGLVEIGVLRIDVGVFSRTNEIELGS